jgi:hypothetical protein
MVNTLFYTGARVSEFIHLEVVDLRLDLEPPQVSLALAKGWCIQGRLYPQTPANAIVFQHVTGQFSAASIPCITRPKRAQEISAVSSPGL